MKISHKAIDNPLNTTLFVVFIMIAGIFAFTILPLELFPDATPPFVIVTVPYPGASPSEIENQVIKKLEEELKNLSDVKRIKCTSRQNVGYCSVEFVTGINPIEKESKVKEEVDRASFNFPEDVEEAKIQAINFQEIPILNIAIYGESLDYVQLKEIAKDIQSEVESITGVSSANIYGGLDREMTVYIDPILLWGNQVSLNEVVGFFRKGNEDAPGGKIDIGEKEYYIRILSKFENELELERVVLKYRGGKPLYLKEIGDVNFGTSEIETYARYEGIPAISLAVQRQPGSNILEISDRVKAKLEEIRNSKNLPDSLQLKISSSQAKEVRVRVGELGQNIAQGIAMIFLFLVISIGFRNAVIASLGIPFAMLFAMLGLYIFDETINNITQFGLILVIGIIVDGAIVVLENTYRLQEQGASPKKAAKVGVDEVGSAVVSSGLTTMAGFAPMLFMPGTVGQFMSVIPKTVILALAGSLIFDHIVIPLLCSRFINVSKQKNQKGWLKRYLEKNATYRKISQKTVDFALYSRMEKSYSIGLHWSLKHPKSVFTIAFAIFMLGLVLLGTRRVEFFPEIDLGQFSIRINNPRGTLVEKTNEDSIVLEKLIRAELRTPENLEGVIKSYSTNVGSASIDVTDVGGGGSRGPNYFEFSIEMVDATERDIGIDEFSTQLRNQLKKQLTGAWVRANKPHAGPPLGDPVNVVIRGDDIRILKQISRKIRNFVRETPGLVNLEDNYGNDQGEIQMTVNRYKAERYGISVQELQNFVFILNNGFKIAEHQYGDSTYEIRIRLLDEYRDNFGDLQNLSLYSQRLNQMIPITELVDIEYNSGSRLIIREDSKRAITISGQVDLSRFTTTEVSQSVIDQLNDFPLPQGYTIQYRGENENRDESFQDLWKAFMLGFLLIYFIIVMQLRSFLRPISIMLTIILSIFGMSLGLIISNGNLGILFLLGAVSLIGIVVNDAIVLVSYINLLRDRGVDLWEAVVKGSETRLRPILLTTFTTIGSLLPLALSFGGSRALWTSMAWTIIGGLLMATLQTLLIVPVSYFSLEKLKGKTQNLIARMRKDTPNQSEETN